MYQPIYNPFEELAAYLGSLFGALAGQILTLLAFTLFIFVIWGLPWAVIIAKAGFTGRFYWFLLGLLFGPMVIAFGIHSLYGERAEVSQHAAALFGISSYLGFLLVAFCPWGVHRKLRQLKKTTVTSTATP